MLISPSLACKPSFRKHSSFDKLFDGDQLYQHWQDKQPAFSFAFPSFMPSSPSKKTKPKIYTFICFFFFFITMVAYLRCSSLDTHIDKASPSGTERDAKTVTSTMERLSSPMPAFKGLGSVYRKGTKAMSDLVVAHIAESTSLQDLRMFLRTLHRSGVTARADIVFLYTWNMLPSGMVDVISQENAHFDRLAQKFLMAHVSLPASDSNISLSSSSTVSAGSGSSSSQFRTSGLSSNSTLSPFHRVTERKSGSENFPPAQPFWGFRNVNASQATNKIEGPTISYEYGSMVGFGVSELNPDNALHGFINHPPLALRRWACYQMLLGMVRHRFKHVLLTDVSGVVVLKDPFNIIGKKRASIYITMEDRPWGASLGHELGVRLSSLDMEPGIGPNNVIALRSGSNVSNEGHRLYSHSEKTWHEPSDGKSSTANVVVLDDEKKGLTKGMSGFLHSTRGPWRRAGRHRMDAHRRGGVTKRRRSRRMAGPPTGGLYERVYGRRMWSTLEENEKKKKLVNSAVIMGSMHQVRGLANTMVTEIVKVALERKNREAFPDSVLLSYLLHKSSSVLGKRVLDHLHLLDNADSYVHSLIGSQQPSLFLKKRSVIHGNSKSKRWGNVVHAIRCDICASLVDATVYSDCRGFV